MIRPVESQVALARTPEMAADRVRDVRQTGLTAGTLNEITKDKEEDLRTVKDKFELEMLKVRVDEDGKNNSGQEGRDREGPPPSEDALEQRSLASERLLNLPVVSKQVESKRFDIRV
jgi:hypothetical protein